MMKLWDQPHSVPSEHCSIIWSSQGRHRDGQVMIHDLAASSRKTHLLLCA